MSSYNDHLYCDSNGMPVYPQVSDYPRHGVQVQIPRLPPGFVYQSSTYAANGNQQVYADENRYQSHLGRRLLPQQVNANVLPPSQAQAATNGYLQPKSAIPLVQASVPSSESQMVLLALAEEYFIAAFGKSSGAEVYEREKDINLYYKLIATGLSCLDAVLRQGRLSPDLEARTRLRYASILFQETENYMEAEEALSQGILLCDRHRFQDLKYNMQHLLIHVMFATNPRASLKFLDGVIKDVEAYASRIELLPYADENSYRHVAWVYAFRFLRATLSLNIASAQETLIAINQFRTVTNFAGDNGDNTISATASILEAMTCLRRSNNAESIEQAQRALAAARSFQLDPAFQKVPQLVSMMHFVDISCSLQQIDPAQAKLKLESMHSMLDAMTHSNNWNSEGILRVSLGDRTARSLLESSQTPSGILQVDATGTVCVSLTWLLKDEIYALGFLFSGAVSFHRNAMDGQKSEQYLGEAKRLIGLMPHHRSGPLTLMQPRYLWQRILLCQVQIHLVFALCARTSWSTAKEELSLLKNNATDLPEPQLGQVSMFIHYLDALIQQATGDLASALATFQSSIFALPTSSPTAHASLPLQPQYDLALVAALNTLLIIRSPTHPKHSLFPTLLSQLEPLALANPSKNIHAAYWLLRATSPISTNSDPAPGVVKTKQYLQSVLQAAKHTANNQLMCITLNFMSWKFFKGVVGEQAEKSALASLQLAKKGRDSLWIGVANGMLAETLEKQGKREEADAVRREGWDAAGRLPVAMQREVDGVAEGDEDAETIRVA
ncbi:hypothetical protein MMC11_003866 [Xylographa trunciseda]|nr:hypothetical protein [Xylographa trunciseda]